MDYAKESLRLHSEWRGKLEVTPRAQVDSKEALSLAYTPGVAQPCLEIQKDISKSYELTRRWNTVAVVTDGSAVLGLGDIGPEAGMPVMEGKCALFKEFGDVDAIPLCVRSKNVDDIVNTVKLLAGSFGGVNLEDISAQDDVIDLMNRVQVVFNEAVMQDDTLNNYLAQLKEDLQVEVGEALAEAETASEEETQPAEAAAEAQTTVTKVEATDVVNVRSSDSEQAERLGKVAVGEVLKLLEKKENGWSKVEYNGKEGYIKSEYLKDVEETQEAQAESSASEAAQTAESSAATTSTSSDLPASGKIKIAQTINIRKACSETADKIGTAFPGETLEIVMQQADGWTRVKYNGETGYVKTEVLKVLK